MKPPWPSQQRDKLSWDQHKPCPNSQAGWSWRAPLEITCPDPCLEQGQPLQVSEDWVHRRWTPKPVHSKGKDYIASMGNLLQRSITLALKRFIFLSTWNSMHSNFCRLLPILSLGTTDESLALFFSYLHHDPWRLGVSVCTAQKAAIMGSGNKERLNYLVTKVGKDEHGAPTQGRCLLQVGTWRKYSLNHESARKAYNKRHITYKRRRWVTAVTHSVNLPTIYLEILFQWKDLKTFVPPSAELYFYVPTAPSTPVLIDTLYSEPRHEHLHLIIASNVLSTHHCKTVTLWYSGTGTEQFEREYSIET